jgi:hypothetical protein
MDTSNVRLLQYGPINIMLLTVWTHQTYVVYIMDPSSVRLLQYGPITLDLPNVCCLGHAHIKPTLCTVSKIKPTLFKAFTNRHYVVYSVKQLRLHCLYHGSIIIHCLQYIYVAYTIDQINPCCLQCGAIKFTLLTSWIHEPYVVYNYGPSTLTLFAVLCNQTYTVYIMALENLRCSQYGPIQPFLQPDKHKPDT